MSRPSINQPLGAERVECITHFGRHGVPLGCQQNLVEAEQQLTGAVHSSTLGGYLSHDRQNIWGVHSLIMDLAKRASKITVFAVDSLSFAFFRDYVDAARRPSFGHCLPLTSCFPSTTAAAWTSIIRGCPPERHGVYGTSFLHETVGSNYIPNRNSVRVGDGRMPYTGYRELRLAESSSRTLFEKLTPVRSHYFGRHGPGDGPNVLQNELTQGACHHLPCDGEHYTWLKFNDPCQLVLSLIRQAGLIDATKERTLIWIYVDFDDFVHLNGYSRLISESALEPIFKYAENADHPVILISDHGQTTQDYAAIDVLKTSVATGLFAHNTGGAGRVLYLYPHQNKIREAVAWAEGNLQPCNIFRKNDLIELGVWRGVPVLWERVGDLVVIGRAPQFPSVGAQDYAFEHGAVTSDEMLVPIWLNLPF